MNKMMELVDYFPFFDIELSSKCNLHCTFCPREKIVRCRNFLTMNDIALLNNWLPKKCNIMFSGMGEPFLFVDLLDAISVLSNEDRKIGITTNGQLLDKQKIIQLCDSKLKFLQISINHISSNKYKKITKRELKDLIEKILFLSSIKPDSLIVQLSFIAEFLSEDEKKQIINYCDDLKLRFFFKHIHNRGGYITTDIAKRITKESNCYLFSQFTFISSDGNVLSCCHDIQQKNILGNIYTNSFDDIIRVKKEKIKSKNFFRECSMCNDVGRDNIVYYEK